MILSGSDQVYFNTMDIRIMNRKNPNTIILPVSISGGDNAWNDLLHGIRSRITVNIGKPFGPFDIKGSKD